MIVLFICIVFFSSWFVLSCASRRSIKLLRLSSTPSVAGTPTGTPSQAGGKRNDEANVILEGEGAAEGETRRCWNL